MKLPQIRLNTTALCAILSTAASCALCAGEPLVAYSPNGIHIARAAGQGRIECRNARNGAAEGTFYICHPTAISFSEDGQLLAVAGGRNGSPARIKVWRVHDHQQLCEIFADGEGFKLLVMSSEKRLIVGVSADGRIEAWRVSDGQKQWSRTLPSRVQSVRFSADSQRLLIEIENGGAHQFDVGNGRPVADRADRVK
jgi:WD40 repeat protein